MAQVEKAFKLSMVLALLAIGLILLQQSENGRYQYVNNVVLDTRTGAFWSSDGSHFEPRAARITFHHPAVDNQTSEDDRRQAFRDCIWNDPRKASDCVNQMIAARKAARAAGVDSSSEQQNQVPTSDNANHNQLPEYKTSEVEIQLPPSEHGARKKDK